MRFTNPSTTPFFRPFVTGTTGLVREHTLPGDAHAGRDLAACAACWGPLGETVFVRLRVVSPASAHLAVLSFDRDGFGTLLSATLTAGEVPAELRALLDAPLAVVVSDSSDTHEMLLLDGQIASRTFDGLRLFEREVLGVDREDADLTPDVWTAAVAGDPWASRWVAEAARADLHALVALAGGDVTLH